MKTEYTLMRTPRTLLVAWTTLLTSAFFSLSAFSATKVTAAVAESTAGDETVDAKAEPKSDDVTVEAIELTKDDEDARKTTPWLGVATEEASEALASQLGLEPGIGLVITYVATNSPAAKAGLRKNDLLVQFGDQSLVHPAQLRKLVRVRKEGDEVKLTYYRAGKKETATATLAKSSRRFSALDDGDWEGDLRRLGRDLKDLPIKDAMREQMQAVRESLGNIKIDQRKVQGEVRRSMEEARKALQEALHTMSNVDLGPVRRALEEVAHSGVTVDNDATVTVRSSGKSSKSLVKTDDSGTIVLLNAPKLRLTAHDKDGRLIFDGEIQTDDQRAKVPRDLWERVEPLLKKMDAGPAEEPESKESQ